MDLETNTIVTNRGARVPLKEGKMLIAAFLAKKDIAGTTIGYYKVTSSNDKSIKIGCHKFDLAEIKRVELLIKKGVK